MEQGTLCFNKRLGSLEDGAARLDDSCSLDTISLVLLQVLGVKVCFMEAQGRRLSTIAGFAGDSPEGCGSSRYDMGGKTLMVSNDLVLLSEPQRSELLSFLRRFVGKWESSACRRE
ncbi:MAG: hypothetical protein ABIJ56_16425 [Pseudomonadota bacterium]